MTFFLLGCNFVNSKKEELDHINNELRRRCPLGKSVFVKNEDRTVFDWNLILANVYIGNHRAAQSNQFFTDNKIKGVLNCTKDLPNTFCKDESIEYLRIPVDDSLQSKDIDLMYKYMPVAVEFINKKAGIENKAILIHCYAGRQRSCILAAAYLMKFYGYSACDACRKILEKRNEAFHFGKSLNFDNAIMKYQYRRIQ